MNAAVVFPGQGSQFAGMADPWISHAASKAVLDEASTAIGRDVVAACRDEAALATTDVVQPVLLALEIAAFRVLEAEGATFMGAAGHSLGEFSALVAAGVLELGEALGIVVVRGRAMQDAGGQRPGTMTALIGVGSDRASELCDEVRGLKLGTQALFDQNSSLEEQLETRKVVDRAKGLLMDAHGLSEADAFAWIQKRAMQDRRTMRAVAGDVITGDLVPEA